MKKLALLLLGIAAIACGTSNTKQAESSRLPALKISENGRYFMNEDGSPFFWLGDTGWLLPNKMTREEGAEYLKVRGEQGFNVIQVMVLHNVRNVNVYGDTALLKRNVAQPVTTEGNDPADSLQYDYWDHLDYFINEAEKNGLYMALVPVWGSNVGSGHVNQEQAKIYGEWIANRYKDQSNIIWLNGGDIQGKDSIEVWRALGEAIRRTDPNHLMTYHPRGRTTSSMWFHDEQWLDFNMFQSGHRSYAQGQNEGEREYGEDNWKYIQEDYAKVPAKPTLDGEPSYENIPIGLHDKDNGYWKAADIRRYAYWSVFAGGAGFTYGESSLMQMLHQSELDKRTDPKALYGAWMDWNKAMYSEAATQMHFMKELMLSRPYFVRVPDQSLIAGENGEKYDYITATRGDDYAMFYTYTGRPFSVNMGKIAGDQVKASWFSPRDGVVTEIDVFPNSGIIEFTPPGGKADGNDWVLLLDTKK